ncbi:MAG: peroxiredoxin [Peptostreptococcaceae bacterium]|nr:peroxiredoxin [Peptostreptococcaceae bacterium]
MSPPKTLDLSIPDTDGEIVSLGDYEGKTLVLFFYPKANTSGCTTEALDFKELYPDFQKLDVEVVGISKDSVKANKNFKEKYDLPFLLLSDVETKVSEAYGVYKEKSMYGKKYMGIVRSTFVIDARSNLVKEFTNVKVKGHAQEVLDYCRGL